MDGRRAARGLGWAGLGLGIAEIVAPRCIGRLIGAGRGRPSGTLRALGVREVLHGVDILAHRDPGPGVLSRVAGDVLDAALLGAVARKSRRPAGTAAAFALVLGIGLLDALVARRLARRKA